MIGVSRRATCPSRTAPECCRPAACRSNLRLFRHLESVVDLNAKVSNGTLEFCVAEEQLYRPQVLCAPVDQRRLRSTHCMRSVSRVVEPDRPYPAMDKASVLAR